MKRKKRQGDEDRIVSTRLLLGKKGWVGGLGGGGGGYFFCAERFSFFLQKDEPYVKLVTTNSRWGLMKFYQAEQNQLKKNPREKY